MRDFQAILCGWPGLVTLWRHGRLAGLLPAAGFAILLNGAIVASFVQPIDFPPLFHKGIWATLFVLWCVSTWRSANDLRQPFVGGRDEVHEGLFLQAQAEYLKGHWYEAETLLVNLLKANPNDIDARMLLVGLLRRSARRQEAGQQLRRLTSCPGHEKWELEIARERQWFHSSSDKRNLSAEENSDGGEPLSRAA